MNVSGRVARIESLMSRTDAQLDRLNGVTGTLSVPSESSTRPTSRSSCLFDKGSVSSLDQQAHQPG